MLPGRRESGGQHVVTYHLKRAILVELAVSSGSALDIGVRWFLGASQGVNDDNRASDSEWSEESSAHYILPIAEPVKHDPHPQMEM
ncbi:MAG TPA: hypothetical protein VIL84_04910 [Devosiaceae bacterium]